MSTTPIPLVDLFAGPGGLAEGFCSANKFKTAVSAEMDPFAHKTLQLRAYFRTLKTEYPQGLKDYYNFCNGLTLAPFTTETEIYWHEATQEALNITLGTLEGNRQLDAAIKDRLPRGKPWVLIGGPPCQAYSLVGRARNKGITDYKAEDDGRHFLYKEYLRIIGKNKPHVFVMENVKGILSSKINEKLIFHDILRDLTNPLATRDEPTQRYVIISLVDDVAFRHGDDPSGIDPRRFIIEAEKFGIPQRRHRVILLGVREDVYDTQVAQSSLIPRLSKQSPVSVDDVIGDLPKLRSRISRQSDYPEEWFNAVSDSAKLIQRALQRDLNEHPKLLKQLKAQSESLRKDLVTGALRMPKSEANSEGLKKLREWYNDEKLSYWLNHEARSHMTTDLTRYFFAACFAKAFGKSPKGVKDFFLSELRPAHKNWETGKFADRFRVQLAEHPATTVTSHISKDGHYFIHPDPTQCRTLTVREAARIQTFPDNYFFQGNRTQQYHQVGNAVPPLLAKKIAEKVFSLIRT